MTALLIAQSLVVILLTLLVIGLLRSHAQILRALHSMGVGEDLTAPVQVSRRPAPTRTGKPAHDVTGRRLGGGNVKIAVVDVEHPTLIAFLSTGCASCQIFWESFREGVRTPGAGTRLVVVTKGPEAESESRIAALAPGEDITLVQSTEAWEAYEVPVTPYFVLVDGDSGVVLGEGSGTRWEQVYGLMRQALDDAGLAGAGRRDRHADDGEFRADAELRRAGIGPGHESLYPDPGGEARP
jgi:hypothetical protein